MRNAIATIVKSANIDVSLVILACCATELYAYARKYAVVKRERKINMFCGEKSKGKRYSLDPVKKSKMSRCPVPKYIRPNTINKAIAIVMTIFFTERALFWLCRFFALCMKYFFIPISGMKYRKKTTIAVRVRKIGFVTPLFGKSRLAVKGLCLFCS